MEELREESMQESLNYNEIISTKDIKIKKLEDEAISNLQRLKDHECMLESHDHEKANLK